ADVGEAIPLRRVLEPEGDDVIGPDIDVARVAPVRHLAHMDVQEDVRGAVHVLGGSEDRRMPALVQRGPAGIVEGQAEAEGLAGLYLAHALENLRRGEQVDATELVVVAPVAPGRPRRALLPPLGHAFSFRMSSG